MYAKGRLHVSLALRETVYSERRYLPQRSPTITSLSITGMHAYCMLRRYKDRVEYIMPANVFLQWPAMPNKCLKPACMKQHGASSMKHTFLKVPLYLHLNKLQHHTVHPPAREKAELKLVASSRVRSKSVGHNGVTVSRAVLIIHDGRREKHSDDTAALFACQGAWYCRTTTVQTAAAVESVGCAQPTKRQPSLTRTCHRVYI